MNFVWTLIKRAVLFFLHPLYLQLQKKYPSKMKDWIQSAGTLDFSAMLKQFNWFHRLFFHNALKRIQIDPNDIEKIRETASKGPVLYMMRNWGQIEYNFFNLLFLKENLPLAKHANLTWMGWWMPLTTFCKKLLARAHFFYTHKKFPEEIGKDPLENNLRKNEVVFTFLNLPSILGKEITPEEDVVLSILKATQNNSFHSLQIIPLNLIYDRRPEKAEKSLIDLLFGEKENPGRIRKTVLFFKHFKKRAVARIGNPIDVQKFIEEKKELPLSSQCNELREFLHQIFFKEKKSITGPALKTRKRMIDLVLSNKALREELILLATELKKPTDELYLQAEVILEEIVSDPNYNFIDFWDVSLRWVFHHIYEGLEINADQFKKVKEIAKKSPLVLVPSHRSHVDYLLLSYIFYRENLSMPMIAAGKNLSFWPMGYIFRKSGAYFMRRSFGGDKLYSSLFKTYIRTLIQEGYFQEFFIEGTRSRTGKILSPRTGLLSIFIDCFREGTTEDLYFIPIAINYEKILEENSYAKEAKGNSKTKETVWDLFKIKKYLHRNSGKIYINFAEPISLRKYLSEKSSPSTNLAYQIIHSIEEVNLITSSALVTATLLASEQKQSFSEIFEGIELLKNGLKLKNALFSTSLEKECKQAIQQSLLKYQSRGLIKEEKNGEELFYFATYEYRIHLSYYKNNLIYHLIGFALLAYLLRKKSALPSLQSLENDYNLLKRLFRFEVNRIASFEESFEDLKNLRMIQENEEGFIETISLYGLTLFSSLIHDLIEGYRFTFLQVQSQPLHQTAEQTFLESLFKKVDLLTLNQRDKHPEAFSKFIFQNALKFLQDEKLILTQEKELKKKGKKIYTSEKDFSEKIKIFLEAL